MFYRVAVGISRVADCGVSARVPLVCAQRWRKPRWAPIAPTKLFRVPERPVTDPEEMAMLGVKFKEYRMHMQAIRDHLRDELSAKESAVNVAALQEEERKQIAVCAEDNKKWNERVAKIREAREAEEKKVLEEQQLEELLELEATEKLKQERAVVKFNKLKEEAKHFITPDILDTAIESALGKRPVYCFSIDKDGRRYVEQPDGSTVIVTPEGDMTHGGDTSSDKTILPESQTIHLQSQ